MQSKFSSFLSSISSSAWRHFAIRNRLSEKHLYSTSTIGITYLLRLQSHSLEILPATRSYIYIEFTSPSYQVIVFIDFVIRIYVCYTFEF